MNNQLILCGRNSYIGTCILKSEFAQKNKIIALSSRECNFLNQQDVIKAFQKLDSSEKTILFLSTINKFVNNSYSSFLQNLEMVRNLIAACKIKKISKLIFFSTVDIYGSPAVLPLTEQSLPNPDSWYALAKYSSEWMLKNAEELTNTKLMILRLPGVYGPAVNEKSIIAKMLADARNKNKVIISGEGNIKRDYLYVEDLINVLQVLISLDFSGTLNVATGKSKSIADIAKIITEIISKEKNKLVMIEKVKKEGSREFDLEFNISLLKNLIPDIKFTTLEKSLVSYLEK